MESWKKWSKICQDHKKKNDLCKCLSKSEKTGSKKCRIVRITKIPSIRIFFGPRDTCLNLLAHSLHKFYSRNDLPDGQVHRGDCSNSQIAPKLLPKSSANAPSWCGGASRPGEGFIPSIYTVNFCQILSIFVKICQKLAFVGKSRQFLSNFVKV